MVFCLPQSKQRTHDSGFEAKNKINLKENETITIRVTAAKNAAAAAAPSPAYWNRCGIGVLSPKSHH